MQIQVEVSQLVSEVDRIASSAQFNGMNMLTGRFAKEGGIAMSFQIGANVDQNISINVASATASALGLTGIQGEEGNTISIASADEANSTIATIDEALKCKQTGEEKTIVLNFSGHGMLDLKGYASYFEGTMQNAK